MNTLALPATRTAAMMLPFLFIIMWSSGYVAGKLGLPYAEPFTLIFIRFFSAALILLMVALAFRAPWPKSWKEAGHIAVVGALIQALQFSGLYGGLSLGVSAGVSALIVGMMPISTALGAAIFLKERVSSRQWGGLLIGLLGVVMVVSNKIAIHEASVTAYLCVVLALIGVTIGTLYQKRFCSGMDLRTGGFIQLSVASLIAFVLALRYEGLQVEWSLPLILSSGWLSVVNSIGAISLLFVLVRRGEASRVAGLFYLIPAATALMGFLVLQESLSLTAVAGFLVTASGVYLATKKHA